jgi:hypothetical protein
MGESGDAGLYTGKVEVEVAAQLISSKFGLDKAVVVFVMANLREAKATNGRILERFFVIIIMTKHAAAPFCKSCSLQDEKVPYIIILMVVC